MRTECEQPTNADRGVGGIGTEREFVLVHEPHMHATNERAQRLMVLRPPVRHAVAPNQRRRQIIVLVGSSVHTDSDMESWAHSVDLVVNLGDVPNIKHVLRRCMQRSRAFYTPYTEALIAAGLS